MLSKTPKNTPKNTYLTVIKNTQLISIDLIVKNKENKYLLGLRNNKPAKNFWFVPGGRIRKLEDFADAIKRISLDEIGVELNNGKSLGVYRHLYKDNFDNNDFETEYIVFPYLFTVNDIEIKTDNQHSIVKWYSEKEILNDPFIHINVKKYFYDTSDNKIL